MTSVSWGLMLVVMVHALIFHAMPRFSRPDILFAVTVSDAFVLDGGRALVSRYRVLVWSGAAAALAIGLLGPAAWLRAPFGMMAVVAGNMLVGAVAWLWAHGRARAHAVPHSDTRIASLVPRDTSLPGGALFAGGPFAILLATAALVAAHWDQIPTRTRPLGPFGPLAMGGVQVSMMLAMAVSLSRRTRQIAVDGAAAAAEQQFRRVNVFVIVLVGYGMAIMLSTVTLEAIPAFAGILSARLWIVMLPMMLFNFGVALWMVRVGQGGQRAVPAAARERRGDATPDQAWKIGGLLYFNPNDPAIWVEKRVGFGYTLNIGNSSAWLLIGMMLLPVIAARLFLF
jgi:uncharacterized protein DUF5808